MLENSLLSGSEQNAYYSEAYLEHCQTSKMECFEELVEGTIFAERYVLDVWQGSEYVSAACSYFRFGKKLMH